MSLKEKILKILYARRTLSGEPWNEPDIVAEYIQTEPTPRHLRQVTIEVETSDIIERVPGEISMIIKCDDQDVCMIFLDPSDALRLSSLLVDPLKG